MAEQRLKKYSLETLPNGRLPTPDELIRAIQQPHTADPLLLEYLRQRPAYEELLRELLRREAESNEHYHTD